MNQSQIIADKVIEINNLFEQINDVKSNVNYFDSLKNKSNKKIYEGVTFDNFQFESLESEYLIRTFERLEKELEEVKKVEVTFSDVDDEDYK